MKTTLLLVSLLTIGIVFGDKPEKACNSPADIVFVLDESGSIYGLDFIKQLNFVQSTIETFDVGLDRTHIGVMTFATKTRVIFPLKKFTEEAELNKEVNEITQARGQTYTHDALKVLREKMFSATYARPDVRHVAIVITDGESDNPKETAKEAKLCHEQNIQVFAIGVGEKVVRKELDAIASAPDLVFTVDNYAALETLRVTLASKACETAAPPPPPTEIATEPPAIDIQACQVTDQIWSISDLAGVEETNLVIDFINSLTLNLTIDSNHVQVGLAPRICDERNGIRLKDHDTGTGFRGALDKRRLTGLRTFRTIRYIREQGYSSENGGRPNAVKYAILIVDNGFENWEQTLAEASGAKADGVRLIVIGVGDRVQQDQVLQLAYSTDYYFYIQSYQELANLKIQLIQTICAAVNVKQRYYFKRFFY